MKTSALCETSAMPADGDDRCGGPEQPPGGEQGQPPGGAPVQGAGQAASTSYQRLEQQIQDESRARISMETRLSHMQQMLEALVGRQSVNRSLYCCIYYYRDHKHEQCYFDIFCVHFTD